MTELDEIMEGKHEIKHLHIEGDTIAFETELDSHTWNLSPRDIEIIIYCLQKENNKQKEVLDKIRKNNARIIDYGFDYDGFNNVEDLKKLIDMLVDYAKQNDKLLEEIE